MKRKLFFITFLMLFCSSMFGQHWTMTEADEALYNSNMTVTTVIEINGEEQRRTDLEIAAFCNNGLRGVGEIQYKESTDRYIATITILGGNVSGETISFKLFDPELDNGKELNTTFTVNFVTDEVIGKPSNPISINFNNTYWSIDISNLPITSMQYTSYIKIDGEEQRRTDLELAAFSGETLCGWVQPIYSSKADKFVAFLTIYGEEGDEITLKLYDPELEGEKVLTADSPFGFLNNNMVGNPTTPLEFRNNPIAQITNATGNHYFSSLEAAVAAAQNGETIKLLQDVTLEATLTIEKSITIDGNGFEILPADDSETYSSAIMVGNSGWGDDHGEVITLNNIKFNNWKSIHGVVRAQGVTLNMTACEFNGNEVSNDAYGVLSLNFADATVKNTIFNKNQDRAIDINYNGDNSNAEVTIEGCTFEKNVSDGAGIVVRNDGDKLVVTNSNFIDNTVTTTGNAATIYAGWGEQDEVSGCTFSGNTVTTSHATTIRFASAIFCDGCTVARNAFEANTATRNGEIITTTVAVGAYYGAANVSENYWGGNAPVPGLNYTVEFANNNVAVNDYYKEYTNGVLTDKVTLNNVAKAGKYYYESITAAFAAVQDGETVTMLHDVSLSESIKVNNNITLDLNGKTITGTDNETASFALFEVQPSKELTVKDENNTGKITLTATNNRGWNAYSSVISNQRGKLTVNGGTIEHLGGTDMAYGIDNLTNGKGTYAETIINGGTVKSLYRAIRQFLNGIEAQNILTINGGTIEGANKSIWMQSANANANPGKLTIVEGVTVKGNILLEAEPNATSWPVEVSIVASTLKDGAQVMTEDLPSGYELVLENGVYSVYHGVAKIGNIYYDDLSSALKAITSGCTLEILTDITISSDWDCRYTGAKIGVPVTINGNGKTIKFTGKIYDANWNTLFRFEDVATVKNLTLDASAATDIQRGITFKTSVTVDNCTLIGNGTTARYAVIVGEGATAIGDVTANITNSTFKDWIKGVTDNMNGQDMKEFAVTGCTFDNTDVIISAYEKVTFTGNTTNSDVQITSYTADNELAVTAKDNTLATDGTYTVNAGGTLDLQDEFLTPVADVNGKIYFTLQDALNYAVTAADEVTVTLLDNINLEGKTWTPVYFNSYIAEGTNTLIIDGNNKTISNLSDMLFSKTWTGTKLEVKNLTISKANIKHDVNDAAQTVGVGAVVGNISATEKVIFDNVKLVDSHVEGGHWTGGLIGYAAGYSGNDGPVFTDIVIKNCEISGSTIVGKGSVGGVVGHATGDAWTSFGVEATTISNNTITSTGSSVNKAGIVMGTIGAAGTEQTTNNISHTGGVFVSVTESGNTATSNGTAITRIYGRQGSSTGILTLTKDGLYQNNPIEENVAYAVVAPGFKLEQNTNGTYGVVVDPDYGMVAKIGETRYAKLAEAFTAAAQTEELTTIELLPVTIEEGTVKLPATLKNVTVKGAEGAVLKDMTIMAADGNSINYEGITFDGVVFENSCISVTGWRNNDAVVKNFTVTNCVFKNLDNTTNVAPVHFNMEATEPVNGFTFTNNVIDGATGGSKSGVYAQVTGETVFTNNVINNVSFRPYVIQLTTDDGIDDNFTVTGNTFSGSAAGRAQGLGNNAEGTDEVELTVSNNIFKGITDAQQICYWNFNEATTTATLEKNYYDIDVMANPNRIYYNSPAQNISELSEMGIFPIYEELNDDGTINEESLFDPVAYVETKAFETLDEAFAGQDGTIVLLKNIELTEGLTVAAGKTFTLDLNGKVVSGVSNTAATSAVITNNGNLTVKTSVEGGKITSKANNPDQNSIPAYANNTITNCGVLTLLSGTIENSTEQGLACFPIDNNSTVRDAVLNINGGTVTGRGAIRQFANSNINKNEVNVTAGTVTGTSYAIWVQNPGSGDPKASLKIEGGELSKILMDPNANFEGSIRGGTITEVAIWEPDATNPGRNPSGFITGGTFGMDVTEFCAFNYVCTSNGDGTYGIEYKPQEDNAFVIETLHELEAFRDAVNAGNNFSGKVFKLKSNIDLNPTRAINIWEPIGTQANPFEGTFDGGDHTISDLVVEGENNVGLFGYATSATIKNVKLENVNVKGTDCVGAIAGQVYSTSLIDNCHVSGSIQVEGQTNVGGIVGKYYTKVKNCSVIGDGVATSYVKGTYKASDFEGDNIAGIMGHGGENNTFTNNTVKNITISGTRKVGGIVGVTDQNTDVTNCVVENVNIVTTATAEYAEANKTKAGHAPIVGSYTSADANNNGTVIGCTVKNVTFVNDNNVTASFGPITGGARGGTNGMLAPSTDIVSEGNLIYMSTITGTTTNMYLMNPVAKIGETAYYTLFDAVAAVQDGETITMLRNTAEEFAIDNTIANITLNMAGFTLTGAITPSKANLTIENGTINNENSEYSAIEINEGTLVLNYVKVTSKRHGVRIDGPVTATINGGEYRLSATSGTRHAVNVSGGAEVTIKDGTFEGPAGTTMDSGSAVCVQADATVTIEGGEFSGGKNATLGVSGTMIVKGGTFDQDPSAYLADAYTVNIENEMYVVRYTPIMVTYPVGNPVYPEGKVEYYSDMLEAVPYTTNCPRLEGATITLLADVSGAGMRFMENDMVFDLNGHTYTITDGTGSQGTNTSGFQIRSEVTTNVLFKDGTIKVAEGAPVAWMFNCYATDFIVENVTVDCSNMAYSYGGSCYVVVSREGDNVQLTGETKIVNFNSDVAGNAINVGDTMTIGEYVDLGGGTIELDGGAQLTARAGLNVVTVDGYMVVYENGVYKSVKVVAQVGDVKYESVAAAMTAAKEDGVKDLEITIIGENTQDTDDSFNLSYATAFDNVTIKQNNDNKPFYIESIYTGDRTSTDGKFVFDGVNMIITGQIWFECDVVLTNNSSVKRSNDVKNFIYYGEVTVEPGSKYISQIDDVMAGSFTVDGGKTDGTYNEAEDFKTVFFDVRDGQTFTAKNGANILISSGEGGKLSLKGNANIDASKVYVYNEIALGDNGKFALDIESSVTTNNVTGKGVISVDALNINEGVVYNVITANMSSFAGIIEINNDDAEYEITSTGLVVKMKPFVAEVDGTQFTSLQGAFEAVQDNGTITLLRDVTFDLTTVGYQDENWVDGVRYNGDKSFTVNFNTYKVTDNGCVNDYLININNKGEKDNEITFTNGTIESANGCWATVCVGAESSTHKTVLNLNDMNIINKNDASYSGNLAVRVRGTADVNTTVNVNTGTTITSDGASYGIAPSTNGAVVNINSGAIIEQKNSGTSGGNSVFAAVGGKGTVNIYDGAIIRSDSYGVHTMTTGTPVVNIYGGTITAVVALKASTNGGDGQSSTINVSGGMITGALEEYTDNAQIILTGGRFSTDVNDYCHEYYDAIQGDDNLWRVEQVLFAQTTELQAGWNWYSSYINLATPDGLEKIQTALGEEGIQIKGNYNNNSSTYENLGNGSYAWIGDFTPSAKQMYMINTSSAVTINVVGEMVDYKETPINLRSGWNWIGYPVSEAVDVNTALADLNGKVSGGDVIKTFGKSSQYSATSGKWFGQLKELKPGEGYMYKSSTSTSFVYSVGTGSKVENVDRTIEEKYWMSDVSEYANNMTVVAMLSIDGEIVKDNYEIAAFVNGECRGSERPIYVEELDAYVLFLTVHGDDVEELTFKYYDVNYGTEYELSNRINYSNDAVVGSVDEPYMFNLDILNIGETSVENISIYPNPTTTGSEINLQAVCDKVEVFNALGVKVAEYTNVDSIDAIETAGVYVIRLTIDNSARNCRLIVK